MNNQLPLPYSVFTENRPLRIAYLVNPNDPKALKIIHAIIKYNQDKWGGRYNPIILTNGKTISKEWWKFLSNYDPDIIKSFVAITKPLLKRFNNHLTPYLIEDFEPTKSGNPPSVYLQDEGLSVLPTKESIAQVTGFTLDRTFLVLFEIDEYQETDINTFLKVNFGTYQPQMVTSSIIREYPKRKEYVVKSEEELTTALSDLNTFDTFVYPSMMCTLPSTAIHNEYNHEEENFTVIVGDSINDIVYYWNRVFSLNFHTQTKLNAIWISNYMATNPTVVAGLNTWIKRAVDPGGNGQKTVRFVSFSKSQQELDGIATQILNETHFMKVIHAKTTLPLTNFKWDPNLHGIKERLYPIRVNGDEAHITVPLPSLKEGVMGGQHWMTDIYIEFHPERFTYIHGINYWWQLPKNNDLAMDLFHTQSRICSNGIPAVLLKRDAPSVSPYPNNKIKIQLLEDSSIFQILIVGDKRPIYTSDPRSSLAVRPYNNIGRSDKGRYLSGVLDLFSSLYGSYSFLEQRYWRRMFDILSQQNPQKDEVKKQTILNKINKEVKKQKFDTAKSKEWLAEYILRISKEQSGSGKELPFLSFKKEEEKEIKAYNDNPKNQNKFSLNEAELKGDIHDLIESGILATGVRPRCRSCGLASWYHIDETKQILKCKGCGYEFGLRPEQTWYYRLNSLVLEGVSRHYLIPVILALGQLLSDARSSFIWTTSIDLFTGRSFDKQIGDLDIVCIQDGKFIIGEVKNVCSLFSQADFDKMETIARKIRPDKLIFSALEEKPTPAVAKMISDLADKLQKEEIEVEWLKFPNWIFEPKPL
jgi:hypothetical protein